MGTRLEDLTWIEAEKAFRETRLALVPTGSVEQHGPHLPLGTDMRIAEHLANEAARNLSCVVTPVVPVGHADYHNDFKGTLAVPPEVFEQYVKAVCLNLAKHGTTHILFVNGHGGNLNSLLNVADALRKERELTAGVVQWWDIAGHLDEKWNLIGHGDISETSMMLAINKKAVKVENAHVPENRPLTEKAFPLDRNLVKFGNAHFYMCLRTSDITDTGDFLEYGHFATADYTVSPAGATAENGKELIKAVTDYIVALGNELLKINLGPVRE